MLGMRLRIGIKNFISCGNKNKFTSIHKISLNFSFAFSSKIYTKTGDKGTTSLLGGMRKRKDDEIFDLLGDIDELNSYIGLCSAYISNDSDKREQLNELLTEIQNHIYHISAYIASLENEKYLKDIHFEQKLEKKIDQMEEILPPLKNFINPGGSLAASHLQVARAISRRVERRHVQYSKDKSQVHLKFFNRLSDFLFVASRYVNHLSNQDDQIAK